MEFNTFETHRIIDWLPGKKASRKKKIENMKNLRVVRLSQFGAKRL